MQGAFIMGQPDDSLIAAFRRASAARGIEVTAISEEAFFTQLSFSFAVDGQRTSISLFLNDDTFRDSDLHCLVLRPSRTWWPRISSDFEDRTFIFHETLSAWYSVLDAFSAPVVNRFPLTWWLCDTALPGRLVTTISQALGIAYLLEDLAGCPQFGLGFSVDRCDHVYVVGPRVIGSPGITGAITDVLTASGTRLLAWQEWSGIRFMRLDLLRGAPCLIGVEPMPALEGEDPDVVTAIAEAMVELTP